MRPKTSLSRLLVTDDDGGGDDDDDDDVASCTHVKLRT